MKKRICDLPEKLVGEKILSKVPITSLKEVRSTCKIWDRLSKDWIVGKEAARQHQFLGFITVDDKVCSLRFRLGHRKEEEDSVDLDLSIKQIDLLNQIEMKTVFHCDGLLLCVAMDRSRLVVWNPYLGQTKSISPLTYFHRLDTYLFGYDDMNRNHKILRFLDFHCHNEKRHLFWFEIYDFNSDSWRVLKVRPDWRIEPGHRGVSLKGNTYFWAHEKIPEGVYEIYDEEDFILCFDFTREKFGERLFLPFHSFSENTVTLSSVRDEKLALLHQKGRDKLEALEIWITTEIAPNGVTWSKF